MGDLRMDGESVEDASPGPAVLIELLRAFGYDPPSAIADLIDNSIAADATRIWATFSWRGNGSTISIRDNGLGMDDRKLLQAVKLG
jgi:signal transduction histidine kinase